MKSLLIDPRMAGVAGDMLLSALLDLTGDQECLPLLSKAVCELTHCTASIKALHTTSMGIGAIKMDIGLKGERFASAEDLARAFKNISNFMEMSPTVIDKGLEVISVLAEAESAVHEGHYHLHEVGSVDTVIDIAGVLWLLDKYEFMDGQISCLPVAVGNGIISMDHGKIPSPAPATLEILCKRAIPIASSTEKFELATPTGVALLACIVDDFIKIYPTSTPLKTGQGAGNAELESSPNIIRIIENISSCENIEQAILLETLIDDASGEILGHALNEMLDAGALDAYITPATGKKNRPAHLVSVLCVPGEEREMSCKLMQQTGSIGVRTRAVDRFMAERKVDKYKVEINDTKYPIRIKISTFDQHLISRKPEFDDLIEISKQTGLSPRIISEEVKRQCFLPIKDSNERD
ncbi:nickel pincer cofactor biosynthesis protein LarC [Maridesulfovibrio ferrireducens]|uniref:nickel pincer cofactor biosynthesis protein LarC n=1 Tax=Maridesulfovibrio ferrireducens TaxID=246191 RepID=UPI001A18ACB9|nr:nickel pincer cofactor biosynthesis protein LarC [Maridesulfovibrio ferrireducens]MBI9111338.1 nickel pincer cofactor biosynthesis protein LarC [Maridesulfovibrio ferrireducens]